jgi:hypothetical protein
MIDWLIYLVMGKLMIFLGMKFPLPDFLERNKKIREWHSCPLCFGVYVYAILSFVLHLDLLTVLGFWYVPFVSELITGGAISFLVYIFSVGWKDVFAPEIVV